MRLLNFTCFLSALLLCSCEEPFELGVDIPSQIVIDSRVHAGRNPLVTVRVVDGLGQTIKSDVLKESKVFIQPDQDEAIAFEVSTFSDSSSTFYSDYIIQGGVRYTLLIQAPGFADLRSVTEVPVNVPVRKSSSDVRGPNGGYLPKGDYYHLPLEFDDPKEEDNFFHMVVTVRDAESTSDVEPETLAFGLFPRPSDARRFNNTGWMFSDDSFKDGVFSSEFLVSKEVVAQYPKPIVTLELRSVSVDYFNFHVQRSRIKTDNLPNSGQFNAVDNVAGGVGLFGGYSSNETTYHLEF